MSTGKTIIAGPEADRYVIACESPAYFTKVFQIAFGSDGSVFVTVPYARASAGRVGIVTCSPEARSARTMRVGKDWPVTSHWIKYSHHPSGIAHFSLTGKVRPHVRRQASPLAKVNGHLFTVMIQGMRDFAPIEAGRTSTSKRQVIPFGLESADTPAVKFVGHLISLRECGRRIYPVPNPTHPPWFITYRGGQPHVSILLATPFCVDGERYFLHLWMERIPRINPKSDIHVSILGGFDEPNVALDQSQSTSFLMCLYPEQRDFSEIAAKFGSIDLA